jgi:hypothetical protein
MEILNDSAKQCSNQRKYGKNKLKLNIWNNDIKIAIKQHKVAHKQWKEAGKPKRPEHPLLVKIWIVRGLCQIMKVLVPAFKYIVAFI